jgi:hypothetical protein
MGKLTLIEQRIVSKTLGRLAAAAAAMLDVPGTML